MLGLLVGRFMGLAARSRHAAYVFSHRPDSVSSGAPGVLYLVQN